MQVIYLILFISLGAACNHTKNNLNGPDISYLDTAKKNFLAGEAAFARKNYEDAVAYFEYVRSKFPYTQFAAQSDLRVADIQFEEEKWLDAASAYDFFIRFHPRDEQIPYALFKVAESYFKAMPTDFFLFPGTHVRDQRPTKDAYDAILKYLAAFPAHTYAEEAKKIKLKLIEKLAQHDLAVAAFYKQRKMWRGALARYQKVIDLYGDTSVAALALLESSKIPVEKISDESNIR